MKYKSENDFVIDVCKVLKGHFISDDRDVQIVSEVPRYAYMNHYDILLIDRTNKLLLGLEFKLKYTSLLKKQINGSPIKCLGIINYKSENKGNNIFEFTGKDEELEIICYILNNRNKWNSINVDYSGVYWWGYLKESDNFNGGIVRGKRLSLYMVYRKAIKNLIDCYGKMDFYIVYNILRGFYSESVAYKHYNYVLKNYNII
jgi:hypothetical protein